MPIYADSHAHLYGEQFAPDRPAMIDRALAAGVRYLFLPNIDTESIDPMLSLEDAYPEHCFAMMGLHPCSAEADYKRDLSRMEHWLGRRRFVGIGETGLDYYWSRAYLREQEDALRIQCRWAKELGLPIVLHARDSMDPLIAIIRQEKDERLRGIFHCFSGDERQAQAVVELGFLLGIGGVLTYKNSTLPAVLAGVELKHLVLETDSPYLTPVPHRGKRNESAYIPLIAERLALVKQTSVDEVARITTGNALNLFGITEVQ